MISIMVMIAAGAAFYYSVRTIVYNQVDDALLTEKTIIQDQIDETDSIPDFTGSYGHIIKVRLLGSPAAYSQVFKDTNLLDDKSGSYLPFRHIRFTSSTPRNTGYIINIYEILDENKKLVNSVTIVMCLLFLSLLLTALYVNYLVSKKLWSPFFDTVNEAAKFNVLTGKFPELRETNINEFQQLNIVIDKMTRKMHSDYINLKEYNENSAHEIQTPLAIIRSKLEILIQEQQRPELKRIQGHNHPVQPARDARAMLRPAGPDRPGRGQGRSRHQRRRVVHAGKHRVIVGAQAEFQHRRVRVRSACQPHSRDVARVVHQFKLRVGGGHRALDRHPSLGEQAEGPRQFDRQLNPARRHRMAGPEVIAGQPPIPGHVQCAGHALILQAMQTRRA